jgi:hypothetical protein
VLEQDRLDVATDDILEDEGAIDVDLRGHGEYDVFQFHEGSCRK